MSRFKWYRSWCKGDWHYNRYNYARIGGPLIFKWERVYLGNNGGFSTTIKSENYG